ncbi:hypothetical protein PAXRUDRAFT_638040 [Paxillus rubicundulus Ve08.2h10]|uniref:Unplaced genomic scaffold scaffold_580, whole genome shotgun sequence n=1 Tax=Paxillus rubicundulus Ve08.2h10 TaxID=930991 RepID=A0A0D0DSS8_9AGAM|nr:hypothetical protein PAXRUDRAFT_638040 [Paxillus rubicundulus Ve08.2h10]
MNHDNALSFCRVPTICSIMSISTVDKPNLTSFGPAHIFNLPFLCPDLVIGASESTCPAIARITYKFLTAVMRSIRWTKSTFTRGCYT